MKAGRQKGRERQAGKGAGGLTSGLAISAREAASAAHAPPAGPTGGRGDGVVVHALICRHQLIGLIAAHLHMLAHKAACSGALVVAARVWVALHHLLSVLAPPAPCRLAVTMLPQPSASCSATSYLLQRWWYCNPLTSQKTCGPSLHVCASTDLC